MWPSDRVLGSFGRDEPGVLELDARHRTARRERHAQPRGPGRHRRASRLTPGDLEDMWPVDPHEVAANQDAVDVDREHAPVDRFEARGVAHPSHEQLGSHEVIEHSLGRGFDVDARAKRLGHRFFSTTSLSAASRGVQNASTKAATGAKPSGLIA